MLRRLRRDETGRGASTNRAAHVRLSALVIGCLICLLAAFQIITISGHVGRHVSVRKHGLWQRLEGFQEDLEEDADFIFPTVEDRLRYYMGQWYNRSLASVPCVPKAPSSRIKDKVPLLYSYRQLAEPAMKDWRVNAYIRCSFDVINKTGLSVGTNDYIMLQIGDEHSQDDTLPTIAKTRFSRHAKLKGGKTAPKSIIWPLVMQRHFLQPIEELLSLEGVSEWEDKKEVLLWRGSPTGVDGGDHRLLEGHVDGGVRINFMRKHYTRNQSNLIDVGFSDFAYLPSRFNDVKKFEGNHLDMKAQLDYKYLLSLEGNDVATALKWQLASNSVVFMTRPSVVSFLMEDLLVPYVHYIPLQDDFSDLEDMVRWAKKNDKKARWIANQATKYMENLWMSEKAKKSNNEIAAKLGTMYHAQFNRALKLCT